MHSHTTLASAHNAFQQSAFEVFRGDALGAQLASCVKPGEETENVIIIQKTNV